VTVGHGLHPHHHDHHHDHPHDHPHPDTGDGVPEGPLGPSGEASVVLDIGPHAGALVVYAGEELAGAEIEIRPGGGAWRGAHTAVRERHVAGRVLYAGVFGSLAGGRYDLRLKGGGPGSFEVSAEVVAGSVREARVPTSMSMSVSSGPSVP
jgi:hypothetical protein